MESCVSLRDISRRETELVKQQFVCLRQISRRETKLYMYYIYVLKLSNNDLYIGYTTNLEKRLKYHQQGKSRFTKPHRPVKLVYYEAYLAKKDATKREYYLKSGQQRELLKQWLNYSTSI